LKSDVWAFVKPSANIGSFFLLARGFENIFLGAIPAFRFNLFAAPLRYAAKRISTAIGAISFVLIQKKQKIKARKS